jgi:hypothetical protein
MELECSSPCSQENSIAFNPEPDNAVHSSPITFLYDTFLILSYYPYLGISSKLFPTGLSQVNSWSSSAEPFLFPWCSLSYFTLSRLLAFPTKGCQLHFTLMRATFLVHVICVIIFGKEYEFDLVCGLVVTVPGYRSRGPRSIPGATRFSET